MTLSCFCTRVLHDHPYQEPTETSKHIIRTRCLGHVTGFQPIRDQYILIRPVPALAPTCCVDFNEELLIIIALCFIMLCFPANEYPNRSLINDEIWQARYCAIHHTNELSFQPFKLNPFERYSIAFTVTREISKPFMIFLAHVLKRSYLGGCPSGIHPGREKIKTYPVKTPSYLSLKRVKVEHDSQVM
eukprot:sb/3471257/